MAAVSTKELPTWLRQGSPALRKRIKRFETEATTIGVRVVSVDESRKPCWQIRWCSPSGGDLNLGYAMSESGEIWTDLLDARRVKNAVVDSIAAKTYKKRLASLWGGVLTTKTHEWVERSDGSKFLMDELTDQQFDDWIKAIKDFQKDVRDHHKNQT